MAAVTGKSVRESLREDYERLRHRPLRPFGITLLFLSNAGFRAIVLYRVARWLRRRHMGIIARILEGMMHHWCHVWINSSADIGPGFILPHVGGTVIGGMCRIGANCTVGQGVTIGGNYYRKTADGREHPWLEDNVSISAGAKVLGPVRIGENSIIGANAVVINDVPPSCVAGGVPSRILRRDGKIVPLDEQDGALARYLAELERRVEVLELKLLA